MSEPAILDKTYHFILRRMIETGRAPHYTEIAAELGASPEEGRKTLPVLAAMKKIPNLALVVPRVLGKRLSLQR